MFAIPAENIVGKENKGWDYAKFLLSNERNGIARVGVSKARLAKIRRLAEIPAYGDEPKIADPAFRMKLAAVEVELKALEMTQMRVIAAAQKAEKGRPNPMSSVLKIKGSEIQQATTELLMDVVGPYALPFEPEREDGSAGMSLRSDQTGRRASRRPISTPARSRSMAGPTRYSAASSPRPFWGSETNGFRSQRGTAPDRRQSRAAHEGQIRF